VFLHPLNHYFTVQEKEYLMFKHQTVYFKLFLLSLPLLVVALLFGNWLVGSTSTSAHAASPAECGTVVVDFVGVNADGSARLHTHISNNTNPLVYNRSFGDWKGTTTSGRFFSPSTRTSTDETFDVQTDHTAVTFNGTGDWILQNGQYCGATWVLDVNFAKDRISCGGETIQLLDANQDGTSRIQTHLSGSLSPVDTNASYGEWKGATTSGTFFSPTIHNSADETFNVQTEHSWVTINGTGVWVLQNGHYCGSHWTIN